MRRRLNRSGLSVRCRAGRPPDGAAFLRRILREAAQRRAACAPRIAVFDVDNTLFDTRPRTLAAARDWDRASSSSWFAGARISEIRRTGRDTALTRGLPAPLADRFHAHWLRFFWTPRHTVHDRPMRRLFRWAERARAAGLRVVLLSGRTGAFAAATRAQFGRAGFPVLPRDIVLKRDRRQDTDAFKVRWLAVRARAPGIAFFLTESCRDVACVREKLPGIPVVLLECSFEGSVHHVPDDVPRLRPEF